MLGFRKRFGKSSRPGRPSARRLPSFRPQVEALESRQLLSTFFVATTGNDANPGTLARPFQTIQHGLDVAAHPGDTVEVRAGTYNEMLTFNHSGSAAGGYISLQNYPGEHVLLSGKGAASNDVGYGNNMVQIVNQSYVKLSGLEIAYDSGVPVQDEAHGVLVQGSGTNVQVRSTIIHDITGSVSLGVGGSGIQVYGSSRTTPYANVTLDGNQIYNCQPGDSQTETLTVNGNVSNFQITNNLIHDDNNIGIDMIGGEADVFGLPAGTQGLPVARNGLCSHNTVYNIRANYGGGFAGGIYVDGGTNIAVTDNVSYQNDMGLEVGAENHGYVASGITVSDNLLYNNHQGGLVFGGYASTTGRVQNCHFINNTVYNSDRSNTGQGALTINFASNNLVANNIFAASANNVLINSPSPNSNVNNTLDYNLYYAPGGVANGHFTWNGQPGGSPYTFPQYQHATGEDPHSHFGNPLFANAGAVNFHLTAASPAVNAGSPTSGWYAPVDFGGTTRDLPPEIGAYEYETGGASPPPRAAVGQPAAINYGSSGGSPAAAQKELQIILDILIDLWVLEVLYGLPPPF
jgi:hypothetical protein